jgi:hypothetical protein
MNKCIICWEQDETVTKNKSVFGCDCTFDIHNHCYDEYVESAGNCLYCRKNTSIDRQQQNERITLNERIAQHERITQNARSTQNARIARNERMFERLINTQQYIVHLEHSVSNPDYFINRINNRINSINNDINIINNNINVNVIHMNQIDNVNNYINYINNLPEQRLFFRTNRNMHVRLNDLNNMLRNYF